MWVGQNIRTRLSPVAFRRWFLLGLLILGIYLVARSHHLASEMCLINKEETVYA